MNLTWIFVGLGSQALMIPVQVPLSVFAVNYRSVLISTLPLVVRVSFRSTKAPKET